MRTRGYKKQFWLSYEEVSLLKKKAEQTGYTESDLIRNLIRGYEPQEKPDERFYDFIKQIRGIGNNLNQIARKANYNNFIDKKLYQDESDKWNKFIIQIKEKYLLPIKKQIK